MKHYAQNSPQAVARILAMMLVADGDVDPEEIEPLDSLHMYEIMGMTRKDFIKVFDDFCQDLIGELETRGKINLLDTARLNEMLAQVDHPQLRLLTCAMALDLAKAHAGYHAGEMVVFRHMLEYWGLTLDDLQQFVTP